LINYIFASQRKGTARRAKKSRPEGGLMKNTSDSG
jgi:hypothetical protein